MPSILIIDDHSVLLEILRFALEGEYAIATAQSGHEALEIIEKCDPDLVITDYTMPGMTGLELIRRIRKMVDIVGNGRDRSLQIKSKFILYSACLSDEVIAQAKTLGVSACLPKPFDLMELKSIIARIIGTDKQFE